jgi:hypothetical protein
MRNSFEDIKRFIAEQDEVLMQANDKQHEHTQRVIGGPRPPPASRSARQAAADEYGEELQTKRRNVFKRALKSLSLKSSNDLSKIEEMLEQLLDDVEALRVGQEGRSVGAGPGTQPGSINSNGQTGNSYQDPGYEPEGQAGTSSTGDQSGYTSNSSRPVPENRAPNAQRGSENRISTVPEGDEEIEEYETPLLERDVPYDDRVASQEERAVSERLATPPRVTGALSNETTPRKSEEKSRKHKSSSSSFFPKISRWSKTTASSMGEGIRNSIQSNRKERPVSEASRSGSDLAHGHYNTGDYYDPNGDDRIRSNYTLDEQQQENRPPSPLVPSQVSENPKYRAHRDSLNLQHPQPRQGPTDRYQSHLESQAQEFANPVSPMSDNWGSSSSLPGMNANTNRYSAGGRLTPISDAGYSEASSQNAPPRPPKIKDDGPLIPQRPPKVKEGEQPSHTDRFAVPQRKPTGPRPITSSGRYSPSNIKRHRYRGSPNQVDDDDDEY